jgi:hypothetical protein
MIINLFAHRGLVLKDKDNKKSIAYENSISSLHQAYNFGFRNIEFDIWYCGNIDKLILKHNQPTKRELNAYLDLSDNFKKAKLPQFADYLEFGSKMVYWCDFKNIDKNNVNNALAMLKADIVKKNINFSNFYFAPFITEYKLAGEICQDFRKIFGEKINFVAVCENFETYLAKESLKNFLIDQKIKFLSINHKLIDCELLDFLPEVEFFAWTVNDKNRIIELSKMGVRNFATDEILPSNL